MGPICNPNWSTSGMRVTLSYITTVYSTATGHADGLKMGINKWI